MSKEILLDVSGIMDRETFHEVVSTKLNFPAHYGFNMDAFWDCIADPAQSSMPNILVVEGLSALNGFLPELHDSFIKCLKDYLKLHPDREVVFRQDSPSGKGIYFEED